MPDLFHEVANSVTAPRGFRAGGTACGIKSDGGIKDLAVLISDVPCIAAGTFTTSKTYAAPVKVRRACKAEKLRQSWLTAETPIVPQVSRACGTRIA